VVATVLAVDIPLEKEIVIVDDFSTDGTREILSTWKISTPEWCASY